MNENHKIDIGGVPEQNVRESLEGLKNSEVRNLHIEVQQPAPNGAEKVNPLVEGVAGGVSPTIFDDHSEPICESSSPRKDIRAEIGATLSKCFSNFLKDWVGSIEYQGHCWIPDEDFDRLCKALSDVSSISAFSMQDEEMIGQIDNWGPSALIHVRVFSTLSDCKGHRTTEVSGTLSLGVVLDNSAAYIIGGITEEDPIVVTFHCSSRLYEFTKYVREAENELVTLFRVPKHYGNAFVRIAIGREIHECKEVSRYQAERELVTALRRAPEKEKKRGLICDLCGKEAGPNADLTTRLRADGHYKGSKPLQALDLVSVDGEIKALCSTCSHALTGEEQAA
jgi:hypothetical protein